MTSDDIARDVEDAIQLVQAAASDVDEIRADASAWDSVHIEDLAAAAHAALQKLNTAMEWHLVNFPEDNEHDE